MSKNINLNLNVSADFYNLLDQLAEKSHSSKGDVLKKSLILLNIIMQEKKAGHKVGVFGKDNQILKEFVNL